MKYNQGLGGLLFGGTAVLLATQPVWAAPTQVTGVRVQPVGNNVQVILDTKEGDRPQIFTVNRQNVFVADITNTQLRLPQGEQFNQQNPAPGIAAVSVTQLAPNSIRLQVTGTNAAPTGEVAAKQSEGITFSFSMGGGSAAAAPRTPNAAPNPSTAQVPANQTPLVPNPTITYEGGPAPAAGAVQPVSPAPPFLPRAVAPPVGDIAVSEVNPTASAIDLGTAERIPRLLLRDAPVREVLTLLARAANRNVDDGVEVPIFGGDPAYYRGVKAMLDGEGLASTVVAIVQDEARNPLSAANESAGVDYLKWLVDCSVALGAEVLAGPFYQPLGVFSGKPLSDEEWARLVRTQTAMADHAGSAITLAVWVRTSRAHSSSLSGLPEKTPSGW